VVNVGLVEGFVWIWFRSWLIAFLLAVPSLLFVAPFIVKRFTPYPTIMPYVNIKITDEHVTTEQKKQLIEGVTTLLKAVLAKNPATTIVVIDEVSTDNWGIAGESVTERRQRGS